MSEEQLRTAPKVAEVDPDHEFASSTSSAADASIGDRPARPAGVPEKFWDPENLGTMRTDALLKSYLELERKLGSTVLLPVDAADQEGRRRMLRALGVPECPTSIGSCHAMS